MIKEAQGKYLIYNGRPEEVESSLRFEEVGPQPLYEVISLIEGVALFFQQHMDRLKNTAKLLDLDLKIRPEEINRDIKELVSLNQLTGGNIKILVFDGNLLIYEYWDTRPSLEDLEGGIKVHFFDYQRENPNAKILYSDFKAEMSKYLLEKGIFEIILRTEDGELLEGGRSNLYFIKDDYLITAPDDRVLKGITRGLLEDLFVENSIRLEKRVIHDYELLEIDGAFLTGTTIDIVPIHSIESLTLATEDNPLMKKIIKAYRNLQKTYVQENRGL